uniref:Dynein light chain n=1 Tax=Chlamydomonas euryale TaxID=1486919 RepID=A0A7R9VVV9_9CHLO|mmetsp:Transcript_5664/g.17275  ORF Transcript_5664/g.17275 Transcript_5664/m.17275 type:complete len:126 (+) Transcript_5664:180-557(+)
MDGESGAKASDFVTEPAFHKKLKVSRVKELIAGVLKERLTGAVYHADNTSAWAREIADEIKAKLKEEDWPRYKYAVQVFIGEQRGEGVRLGCRGFWDSKTDNYAHDTFQNESLFCVAAAFGVYLY